MKSELRSSVPPPSAQFVFLFVRRVTAGRRGNRRSAAGGGRSEPVSRTCPDWRPRQWTGIGWHDGGQPPPLRKFTRGAVAIGRGDEGIAPYESITGGAVGRAGVGMGPY